MSEPAGTSVSVLSAQITQLGDFIRQATATANAQRERTEDGVNRLTIAFEEVRVQVNGLAARVEGLEATLSRRVEFLERGQMRAQAPAAQTNVTIASHNKDSTAAPDPGPAKPKARVVRLLAAFGVTGVGGVGGGVALTSEPGAKLLSWFQAVLDAIKATKGG